LQQILSAGRRILSGMGERWTPRRQGDLGELSAMQWLVAQGAIVLRPLLHSPYYDLIADFDGQLVRVEVKTSTSWRHNRWEFATCTRGGNQSWNGVVKHIDPSRCDYLFAHAGDGRRWYIPLAVLDGRSRVILGGPKYSECEVDSGDPLPARGRARTALPS
jgi:hypothetical protein